jgi:hypothetical protein
MSHSMNILFPTAAWCRSFKLVLGLCFTAWLAACGGGGGGSALPRFERITFEGQAAIKDNSTGYVWAAQLGTGGGFVPTAQELLAVADLGASALTADFKFLLGQRVQASEAVVAEPATAWVVDFDSVSGNLLGSLSNEIASSAAPIAQWRVLRRVNFAGFGLGDQENGTVIQGRLLWSACSLGASYVPASGITPARCSESATVLSLADAQNAVRDSRLYSSSRWRLPTKQELQGLLNLGSAGSSLLPSEFANLDVLDLSRPLQYWTSSNSASGGLTWIVDFTVQGDPGGVEAILPNSRALVRMVRDLP